MFTDDSDVFIVTYNLDGREYRRVINLSYCRSRGMDDNEAAARILAIAYHNGLDDAPRIVLVGAQAVR